MTTMTTTLLSVDWDYFFPNPFHGAANPKPLSSLYLYDWGHNETPFYIEGVWPGRAVSFLQAGVELPSLHHSYTNFWRKFKFTRSCKLYLAESHSQAARPEVRRGVRRVMNFDAHHDCGYTSRDYIDAVRGRIHCGNWMLAYNGRADLEVYYPPWRVRRDTSIINAQCPFSALKAGRRVFREPVSRVFVCRSGAWVPPWHDAAFDEFVKEPGLPIVNVGTYNRKFSIEGVRNDKYNINVNTERGGGHCENEHSVYDTRQGKLRA